MQTQTGIVEYAKLNVASNSLIPTLTSPFWPSNMFHLLFRGKDRSIMMQGSYGDYLARWKASSCSPKPTDPATNQPTVNQCYNYTLSGMSTGTARAH